jgi:hypothetical protein
MLIPRIQFYYYCQPLRASTSFSNRQWMLCTKQPELYTPAPSNVTAFTYIIHTLPYIKFVFESCGEYTIKAITVEWHVTIGYEYFYLWRQKHQTLHTKKIKTPLDKILTDAQFEWRIWLNLTAVQQLNAYLLLQTPQCDSLMNTEMKNCLDKTLIDALCQAKINQFYMHFISVIYYCVPAILIRDLPNVAHKEG